MLCTITRATFFESYLPTEDITCPFLSLLRNDTIASFDISRHSIWINVKNSSEDSVIEINLTRHDRSVDLSLPPPPPQSTTTNANYTVTFLEASAFYTRIDGMWGMLIRRDERMARYPPSF